MSRKICVAIAFATLAGCTPTMQVNNNTGTQGDVIQRSDSKTDADLSAGVAAAPGSTATNARK